MLEVFHSELKLKEPASLSIEPIRKLLPAWFSSYKDLAEEFIFAFSSIPRESLSLSAADFPQEDHKNITKAQDVLAQVQTWKKTAETGDWYLLSETSNRFSDDWLILKDMKETSKKWNSEILPALMELKQRKWNSGRYKNIPNPRFPVLAEAQSHLFSFSTLWQKIEFQGLFSELLNDLSYLLDQV